MGIMNPLREQSISEAMEKLENEPLVIYSDILWNINCAQFYKLKSQSMNKGNTVFQENAHHYIYLFPDASVG